MSSRGHITIRAGISPASFPKPRDEMAPNLFRKQANIQTIFRLKQYLT